MASVDLQGAKELENALGKLGPRVGGKILRKAVRDGAKLVALKVKAMAPKRTGVLAKSVKVRRAKRRKGKGRRRGEASVNVLFDTDRFPELIKRTKDGTRYFYPASVEYGHSRAPPHRFMRPAWDSTKMAALSEITRGLKRGLEKAAREVR